MSRTTPFLNPLKQKREEKNARYRQDQLVFTIRTSTNNSRYLKLFGISLVCVVFAPGQLPSSTMAVADPLSMYLLFCTMLPCPRRKL